MALSGLLGAVIGLQFAVIKNRNSSLGVVLLLLMTGILGWWLRPAVGAISAVALAALPYVFDLSRTAGIDLPSIALTLLYLALGANVVRSGSLAKALLLGIVFAAAFLIKETIIPFAVVPFLLGIRWRVRWGSLARTSAVTLVTASVGMSWWFIIYAQETGRVYRAEFPDWTLGPALVGVGANAGGTTTSPPATDADPSTADGTTHGAVIGRRRQLATLGFGEAGRRRAYYPRGSGPAVDALILKVDLPQHS